MPAIGEPKNSATMAPISARVELILSALKMKGSAAGSRSCQQGLPIAGAIGAHQVQLHAVGGVQTRDGVDQHGEEDHDHDHRRLRFPAEAEPHDHDRGDADDRHGADQIAQRQQAALQEGHAVRRRARVSQAEQLPRKKPASTDFRKVCWKSSPEHRRLRPIKAWPISARRRQQDARHGEADDHRLPEIDQRDAEQRGHEQGIEPARSAEPTCAASPSRRTAGCPRSGEPEARRCRRPSITVVSRPSDDVRIGQLGGRQHERSDAGDQDRDRPQPRP